MNPALISALDRERRAELLDARQFRDSHRQWRHETPASISVAAVPHRPLIQLRRSLGSALVVAGTRLMATNHVTVD
jgi:hypothetical protein